MKKIFLILTILVVFLASSCVIVKPDLKPEKVVVVEHHPKVVKEPFRI
jgi:hypothetical protein